MALNNPVQSTKIEDALLNQNYQKTDLIKLGLFAEELDIPESAEDLIAQLEEWKAFTFGLTFLTLDKDFEHLNSIFLDLRMLAFKPN